MIIENDGYFSSFCWVYTIIFKSSFKNDHFKMIVYFTLNSIIFTYVLCKAEKSLIY